MKGFLKRLWEKWTWYTFFEVSVWIWWLFLILDYLDVEKLNNVNIFYALGLFYHVVFFIMVWRRPVITKG